MRKNEYEYTYNYFLLHRLGWVRSGLVIIQFSMGTHALFPNGRCHTGSCWEDVNENVTQVAFLLDDNRATGVVKKIHTVIYFYFLWKKWVKPKYTTFPFTYI